MPTLSTIKKHPLRWHWAVALILGAFAWLLFVHPDIIETANHSYLLLESIFSGRFMHFYTDVMEHNNTLYYLNNAHYNVVIYLIFALAELPIFIINSLFGLPVNEPILYFTGKLVSIGFFLACLPVLKEIANELKIEEKLQSWLLLFFVLWPPAFFSSYVMGQYDSICLFFTLLSFMYWLKGKYMHFALVAGVGAACKFFALFLFLPLVLLTEKRLLHIIKYGLLSLWLVLPTSLLFMGRTGDMGHFNGIMSSRLFTAKFLGAREIPLFPALYLLLCFAAYLWQPKPDQQKRAGLWLGLGAYSLFFLLVDWHPQWLLLLAPFILLTTFLEKNKTPWFWLDIALSAGFFIYCAVAFPNQLEANLLDFGLVGLWSPWQVYHFPDHNAISFYYNLLPMVSALPMVLTAGSFLAHMGFKVPYPSGTPAKRMALSPVQRHPFEKSLAFSLWFVFGAGMAVWFLPTLFTWLKTFSFI